MREAWYDDRFANHNWDEVRRKYAPMAAEVHDTQALGEIIQLMLGELNGSHLGFYPRGSDSRDTVEGWAEHPDIFCCVSFLYPTYLPAIFVLSAKPNKMAKDRTISENLVRAKPNNT